MSLFWFGTESACNSHWMSNVGSSSLKYIQQCSNHRLIQTLVHCFAAIIFYHCNIYIAQSFYSLHFPDHISALIHPHMPSYPTFPLIFQGSDLVLYLKNFFDNLLLMSIISSFVSVISIRSSTYIAKNIPSFLHTEGSAFLCVEPIFSK